LGLKKTKISKENVQNIYNLTPVQKGMLFYYLKEGRKSEYIELICLKVNGYIDYNIFENAWGIVTKRNDSLRTIFRWEKMDNSVQIVLKNHTIPIKILDFSNNSEISSEDQLKTMLEDDLKSGIDISSQPMRVTLIKLATNQYYIVMTNHHIILDGWSTSIILKEFFESYFQLLKNTENLFEEKASYKEYVKYINSKNQVTLRDYWSTYLSDFNQPSELHYSKCEYKNYQVEKHNFGLSDSLSERINKLCSELRITPSTFFSCLWGIFIHKFSSHNDVAFGTVFSGRNSEVK